MEKYILELPEGQFELNTDQSYNVYGETMFAIDIVELDFDHLPWLDQIMLLRDIRLSDEISILYHPEVVQSIHEEIDASPYWGKDRYEALATFRRLQTKQVVDEKRERKLLKPVVWDGNMRSKKAKVTRGLAAMGYDRKFALDMTNRFLEEKGDGYMNFSVKEIEKEVDEFARDVQAETEKKYVKSDSDKPCTIYLVKFTDTETGETFIKPGITSRDLGERFITDKKHYDIDIIHTAKHTMAECIEREKHIQKRYRKDYNYTPEKGLSNNGNTECLRADVPTDEIIQLMGTSKVK